MIEVIFAMLFLSIHMIQGMSILRDEVEWKVDNKVTAYGQMLTLHCKIADCCVEYSGWVIWDYDSKDFRTIAIDVRDFQNEKYSGKLKKDGFTLVIRNLTEMDINRNYSCTYGGTVGEKKLLRKEETFDTNSEYVYQEGRNEQDKSKLQNTDKNRPSVCAIITVVQDILQMVAVLFGVVICIYMGTRRKNVYIHLRPVQPSTGEQAKTLVKISNHERSCRCISV